MYSPKQVTYIPRLLWLSVSHNYRPIFEGAKAK